MVRNSRKECGLVSRKNLKDHKAATKTLRKETMKRIGYLFEKIVSMDNLILAVRNATKNKRSRRGIIKDARDNPERYAAKVREKLVNGTYYFAPPILKIRREHKKIRHIKVPKFYPDQIIHWALMQVIEPIIMRGMDKYCCGSVKNRGTLAAKKAIERFIKKDERIKYVMKADIHHFFESVDIEVLKQKFRRVIKDKKVLKLIDEILDNGGDGLPIGYYTSQAFSNFYLQRFDHESKEDLHISHYTRYCDDIVFLDSNKRKLHKAKQAFDKSLSRENLKLKNDWQIWKYASRPIDFVGYRFYGKYTLLRKKLFYSLTRAVRMIKRFGIRVRQVMRFLSEMGWAKRINFKRYYVERIKPIISKGRACRFMSHNAVALK